MDLLESTARAFTELACGIVQIRVGSGLNVADGDAFIAVTFGDHNGNVMTMACTDEQARQLYNDLGAALERKELPQ